MVEIGRIERSVERYGQRFLDRVYTRAEQAYCLRKRKAGESLAARFAAKEAVMKALRTGIGGFALTDVEVCRTPGKGATRNAPYLRLHDTAAELAGAQGAGTFHLSLSHTDGVAIAFVVAEQAPCAAS